MTTTRGAAGGMTRGAAFAAPALLPRRAARAPRCVVMARRGVRAEDARNDPWSAERLGFLLVAVVTGAHGVKGEVKARATSDFAKQRLGAGVHRGERFLQMPGRRYPRPVAILAGREASQKDTWILRIEGVRDREAVEEVRGARIYVRDDDRPKMAHNEFMVGELAGLRVSFIDRAMHAAAEEDKEPPVSVRGRRPPPKRVFAGPVIGYVKSVVTREELCTASGAGAASAAVASDLIEVALLSDAQLAATNVPAMEDLADDATCVLVPFVKQIVPRVDLRERLIVLDPPAGLFEIAVVNQKEKPRPPRGLLCAAKE